MRQTTEHQRASNQAKLDAKAFRFRAVLHGILLFGVLASLAPGPVMTAPASPAKAPTGGSAPKKPLKPFLEVSTKGTYRLSFDARNRLVAASTRDRAIRVFSSLDGRLLRSLDTGRYTEAPKWMAHGRYLAVADWKPSLHLYDGATFEPLFEIDLPSRATAMALVESSRRENRLVAVGLFDGRVAFYKLGDGAKVGNFQAHEHYVSGLVSTGGGLVTGSFDGSLAVWDFEGNLLRRTDWKVGNFIQKADNQRVLVRDFSDSVTLFDPEKSSKSKPLALLEETLLDTAFAPSRNLVAAATSTGTVSLFDATAGREILRFQAHGDQILGLDFTDDAELLVTGSEDGTFKIWKVADLLRSR